jgi:hypothetical protein
VPPDLLKHSMVVWNDGTRRGEPQTTSHIGLVLYIFSSSSFLALFPQKIRKYKIHLYFSNVSEQRVSPRYPLVGNVGTCCIQFRTTFHGN